MSVEIPFDPLNPEFRRNPYPRYARLRETSPVLWCEPLQSWLVTGYEDCLAVLRDSRHFAADHRRAGLPVPDFELTVQTLDPPEHGVIRGILSSACDAQDLAPIRRRAREHADELLRDLANRGGGEFMTGFAAPFSLAAICDFLGVEPPDPAVLDPIADAKMQGMDAGFRPEVEEPAAKARASLSSVFETWLNPPPKKGVFGALFAEHAAGNISDEALTNNLHVMFNAGYQSPFSAIGNAMLALLRCERDLTELLDPDTLDLAVEELIRYDAIAQVMNRACAEDVDLGGEPIRRGQNVLLLLAAANRDPEQFERPDDLVLDRRPNRHLGFGRGSHTCLGAFLARDLMKIALLSLREHVPHIRLAGEPVHKAQAVMRCPDQIPVSL